LPARRLHRILGLAWAATENHHSAARKIAASPVIE